VARGYSPIAPQLPRFNTSRDMHLKDLPPDLKKPPLVIKLGDANFQPPERTPDAKTDESRSPQPIVFDIVDQESNVNPTKGKRTFARRLAGFVLLLGLFAGVLSATHFYLRGKGLLPEISNPFAAREGVALMDINLRSEPNTRNEPVGLVSKDSRLKIISNNDNWYEVQIIEHGRPKENENWADRGWISMKSRNSGETVKISR
jgi:hypothetical protein